MRICKISTVVYSPGKSRHGESAVSFTRQRRFSFAAEVDATACVFSGESSYQGAVCYPNRPSIITTAIAIIAMIRPQTIAISDISPARRRASRDGFSLFSAIPGFPCKQSRQSVRAGGFPGRSRAYRRQRVQILQIPQIPPGAPSMSQWLCQFGAMEKRHLECTGKHAVSKRKTDVS